MNSEHALRHLTEQELLQAVVDSADLGIERRAHLHGCAACLQARAGIENRLERLGGKAQDLPLCPRVLSGCRYSGRPLQAGASGWRGQ